MKVYTKRGDKGETSLIGGTRISKYSLRIDTYGTTDELNAFVGLVRDAISTEKMMDELIRKELTEQLITVQENLFTIGSNLAVDPEKSRMKLPSVHLGDVEILEKKIDRLDAELEPMRKFILPGGNLIVSYCHVARTVCRRAERLCIGLASETEVDENIIKYLNRLSDYFFVLSRYVALGLDAEETPWEARIEE